MLGFTPLATAPIADDAGSYITLPSVTTGAPVVPNLTAQAKYSFAPDGITTGAGYSCQPKHADKLLFCYKQRNNWCACTSRPVAVGCAAR